MKHYPTPDDDSASPGFHKKLETTGFWEYNRHFNDDK